mgnify:CR=1 FL=1
MLALSQSFSMGKGCLEHNLRITKGAGIRQNGIMERRYLNEHVIVRGDITQPDYEYNLLKQVIKEKIGDELNKYNERMIRGRHPERVITLEQWIDKKAYTRVGKKKKIICEYVINLGNRHTGCPYEQAKDKDGNLLDKNGKIIPLWDTRRVADYANGVIKESKISKKIKPILKDFVKEFAKANPQAEILGYSIHCDEGGAIHAHLSVLWWSKLKPTKKGKTQVVGYGIAQSQAIRQQYEARGIKCGNERKNNPLTTWRKDMRQLLYEVALLHDVDRLDMGNKEKHKTQKAFGVCKDHYCEELEAEHKKLDEEKEKLVEKENMLSTDIAKQEWYILRKQHPELYKAIHAEYLKEKRSRNAGLVYGK